MSCAARAFAVSWAHAQRPAQERPGYLGIQFVLCLSAGPGNQSLSDFLARPLEGLAKFQIGAFLGADDALCAGNTTQGGFIAALVAVEAVAQTNHHEREGKCVFVSITLACYLTDKLLPFRAAFQP